MSKRSRPNWAEQLTVMRLLADVAALKGDPSAQRQHLIDELNALFHTRCGQFFAADGLAPGRPRSIRHQVLCRDPHPAFLRAAADLGQDLREETDPYCDHVIHEPATVQWWSRARVQAPADAGRKYAATLALEDAAGVTDGAVVAYRCGPGNERLVGVSLHRIRGEGNLRPLDHALLRFALREMRDLARRGHLPLDPPTPELPPRLAQVLERLLRGDGIKQVARELRLSVWTVREHVQRLYRHFGVNTREELMAKFVRN